MGRLFDRSFIFLAIHAVLYRVSQLLYLSQQPRRQHGQSEGADEESNSEDDDADCDGVRENDDNAADAEQRPGDAKDDRGQVQQEHEEPCCDYENRDERRGEYFQKNSHAVFLQSVL